MRGALCLSAVVLFAACADAPGPIGGPEAARHIQFEGARFGFFNYEMGGGRPAFADSWGPTEEIITVVSRDGQPVTEADRDVAARLARQICEEGRREFNTRSRGVMLQRGGISFAGACREW
ncbi:MAG: hypothetical protein JJU15_07765 [Pararhodobacter sp.]|nr:hypothetical protein [Pararhodobacter sp.]